MPNTLYVNKPGGVIAKLKDGTAESFKYGDPVSDDQFADHVDVRSFADGRQRVAVESAELEAHRRAALTENGQVNSSSSPVPGNYAELDEDGAAQLMSNLARFPEMQAALLQHEILFGGNRQKVLDASAKSAQVSVAMRLGAIPEAAKAMGDVSGEPVTSPGDPFTGGMNRDDESIAKVQQERHAAQLPKTPPPTSDSTETVAGRTNDGSSNASDAATATSWDQFKADDLDKYIDQHELPVDKGLNKDPKLAAIQNVEGHEDPQTPPASKTGS